MSSQITTYTHTLPNGLRCVHVRRPSQAGWCGLAIDAGSRDEDERHHGLAHFVEHTIFKGTTHRRAHHILNRMESVGGELNAYTTKEETMLYAVFPEGYEQRAVELIADLARNATFPADELERERDVVMEEAASYRDTPAEAIYDDFEDLLLAGSPLGHNILGTEASVRALTRDDCLAYARRFFQPQNMVFFSLGSHDERHAFRFAEKYFGSMPAGEALPQRAEPREVAPFAEHVAMDTHQAHAVLGARLPGMRHPLSHALMLLNNLLGGPAMNSLLNVELRERRGWVYSVESSLTSLSDCGWMEIYLGCTRDDLKDCMRTAGRIATRLAESEMPASRLERYKKQYCGQVAVSADSNEFLAMRAARAMLRLGEVPPISHTFEGIRAVSPSLLRDAAELIVPARLSSLVFS